MSLVWEAEIVNSMGAIYARVCGFKPRPTLHPAKLISRICSAFSANTVARLYSRLALEEAAIALTTVMAGTSKQVACQGFRFTAPLSVQFRHKEIRRPLTGRDRKQTYRSHPVRFGSRT